MREMVFITSQIQNRGEPFQVFLMCQSPFRLHGNSRRAKALCSCSSDYCSLKHEGRRVRRIEWRDALLLRIFADTIRLLAMVGIRCGQSSQDRQIGSAYHTDSEKIIL
jgi:hypothetical protein